MNNVAFVLSLPHRAVALATLVALMAWSMGLPAWIHKAEASNVTYFRDTLSDSNLSANSTHTIFFTTANSMTSGQSFRIYFDETNKNFDFTGLVDTDVTGTSTGFTAVTTCTVAANEIDLSVNTTNDYIEGTVCSGDTVAAGLKGLRVGLPAGAQVNNPAAANSYVISLQGYDTGGGAISDSGDTRVAVIQNVTVTASVDTLFTFTINGVNANVTVNGDVTTTSGTSTATTVPFGTIAPNTPKLMAQRLTVDTNALNGFAVTVQANQTLTAGNGATIDAYDNGATTSTPTAWTVPTGTLGSPWLYGHWGLTTDDSALQSGENFQPGAVAGYVGNFIGNPVQIFSHTGPVRNTSGQGVGSTTVAYKVQIMELQEAAKDYTATLTYIATPVF